MNDIIKNIEAAQLKEVAPEFHVGDTVKVYGKIKEGNRESTGFRRNSPEETGWRSKRNIYS